MKVTQFLSSSIRFGALAGALLLAADHAQASVTSHHTHKYRSHAATASQIEASQRTPEDSYLQYKVWTVPQLVKQVSSNPKLIHYYARTWHKSDAYVVDYISKNVQESYIPETADYTVYCVRPNGLVYPTRQHMAKGTRVFALSNGTPVMKWLCGNPLTSLLPAVNTVVVPKVSPAVYYMVPTQPVQQVVPVEEVTPVYQPQIPVEVAPNVATQGLTSATHHISPAAFLPIAVVGLIPGHHGGSGSAPLTPDPHGSVPQPSAVPEMSTGSVVAIGFVPLAILAWIASARKSARGIA